MELSLEQKRALHDDGFVVLSAVVPDHQIRSARRAINRSFANGIDPTLLVEFQHQSFCPELRTDPAMTDLLLQNDTKSIVDSLVGDGWTNHPMRAQMAIRFPSMNDEPSQPVYPHLDGMYTPTNGLQPGDIWSHTLLVGVFLSDVVEPDAGNFTVWRGSHRVYEAYFKEHGPESLLEGMPPVDIGEPEQVMARAGDVVLAHYQLGHAAGRHIGPDIRYTVFFRVRHADHEDQKWDAMTDIWKEWPGMAGIA